MTRVSLPVCVVAIGISLGCGSSPSSPSACCATVSPGGAVAMTFTPQSPVFEEAAAAYRRVWAAEGTRISEGLERATGLAFVGRQIQATIYEGPSLAGDRDTPMLLRASYPDDVKKSALAHELGHRLIAQLGTRPRDLDEHRVLFLFLYDVWETLWGQAFADEHVVIESARTGLYDYDSAWKWALSLSKTERASRFAEIVRSNRP
jgi:hypothetical protein